MHDYDIHEALSLYCEYSWTTGQVFKLQGIELVLQQNLN